MKRDEDSVVLRSTRPPGSQRLHQSGDATREAGSLVEPMTAADSPSAISVFRIKFSNAAVTPTPSPPPPNPTNNRGFPSLPLSKKSSSQFEDSVSSQRLFLRRTQPCGLSIDTHEIHPPRPRPSHPRLLKRQLRHQERLQFLLLLRKTRRRLLWQRRQVLQDRRPRPLIPPLQLGSSPSKRPPHRVRFFFAPSPQLKTPPSKTPAEKHSPPPPASSTVPYTALPNCH